MEKRMFNEIRKLCKPLTISPFMPFVKAIWLFGSSVRKKKNLNDIDILILIDDTQRNYKTLQKKLTSKVRAIDKKAEKQKLNLHFQRTIDLSLFWSLLIKGEPWTITAVKNPLVVYDESDYISLIKKLLKRKKPIGEDIKAERLVARAEDLLTDNRELRVMLIEELFLAATEAIQIFFSSEEKIIFEPKRLLKELRKEVSPPISEIYFEIMTLNNKANKGELSEFAGEELDYYSDKIKLLIKEMKELTKENERKKEQPAKI